MKKRIVSLFFALLFICSCFSLTALASSPPPAQDLSKSTIQTDFEEVFVGQYSVDSYLPNPLDESFHFISAIETLYSGYTLYIYVYNPSMQKVVKSSELNTISVCVDEAYDFNKYKLELVAEYKANTSNDDITDALILKYKVLDLSVAYDESRTYKLADIELLKQGEGLPCYFVAGKKFTFETTSNGFLFTTESDLSVIETEVFHTYYRFPQAEINNAQDLRAVYFPVPNKYLEMYKDVGGISTLTAEWDIYDPGYVFVTDDYNLSQSFNSVIGKGYYSSNFEYSLFYGKKALGPVSSLLIEVYNYAWNAEKIKSDYWDKWYNPHPLPNHLYYALKSDSQPVTHRIAGPAYNHPNNFYISYSKYVSDAFTVGKLAVYDELESYYKNKCYADSIYTTYLDSFRKTFLFEQDSDFISTYNTRCSWFESLVNGFEYYNKLDEHQKDEFYNFMKIEKNDILDFGVDEISEKYLVATEDVPELKEKMADTKYADCTWFLLRYEKTDYTVYESAVVDGENGRIVSDYNSYLANFKIVYNFDLIQVGFGDPSNPKSYFVYPFGNSPTIGVVGIFNPNRPGNIDDEDGIKSLIERIVKFLEKVLAIFIIIVVLLLVLKVVEVFKRNKTIVKINTDKNKEKRE